MVRIWRLPLFPQGLPAPQRQLTLVWFWWPSSSWFSSPAGAACTARQPHTANPRSCLCIGMLASSARLGVTDPSAGNLCFRLASLFIARIRPSCGKLASAASCPLHACMPCLILCCLHPSGPNLDQWGGSPTIHYSPIPTNLPPKRGQRSYKRSYPKGDRVRNTPTQKGTEFTQTLLPKRGRSPHKPPTQKGTEVTQTLLPKRGQSFTHPDPKRAKGCTCSQPERGTELHTNLQPKRGQR